MPERPGEAGEEEVKLWTLRSEKARVNRTQKNSQKRVTYLLEVEEGWRTGERVRKHA